MGSAHHSLREHPIMFAFGEVVQIPQRTTRTKKERIPYKVSFFSGCGGGI